MHYLMQFSQQATTRCHCDGAKASDTESLIQPPPPFPARFWVCLLDRCLFLVIVSQVENGKEKLIYILEGPRTSPRRKQLVQKEGQRRGPERSFLLPEENNLSREGREERLGDRALGNLLVQEDVWGLFLVHFALLQLPLPSLREI